MSRKNLSTASFNNDFPGVDTSVAVSAKHDQISWVKKQSFVFVFVWIFKMVNDKASTLLVLFSAAIFASAFRHNKCIAKFNPSKTVSPRVYFNFPCSVVLSSFCFSKALLRTIFSPVPFIGRFAFPKFLAAFFARKKNAEIIHLPSAATLTATKDLVLVWYARCRFVECFAALHTSPLMVFVCTAVRALFRTKSSVLVVAFKRLPAVFACDCLHRFLPSFVCDTNYLYCTPIASAIQLRGI